MRKFWHTFLRSIGLARTDSERNFAHAMAIGSTIVRASATMSAVGAMAGGPKTAQTLTAEAAMVAATVKAQAEGVTDPDEIRARKLAARDAVINS